MNMMDEIDNLLKKYKEKLENFEEMKSALELQMEDNADATTMGNLYYILLKEIVSDLKS